MPLAHAALEPLLGLAMVPGVGPARLALLLRRFGSAERVLAAPAEELRALPGFGAEIVRRVAAASTTEGRERTRKALERLDRMGAVAITPDDLAYPAAFRRLPDAPFLLFATGNLELLGRPGIAIVGTREPTPYGREAAARLSADLARAGYLIVSGMARGIDAAAHAAALDAGETTIGVLGHGIDVVYPRENALLFQAVRERGLLVSELPPGEEPRAGNFPRRNRLIAALSEGVLVVEMGLKSGAQHTVSYALEQGKEVFAVPGPIGSAASAGTNQLLKDGARLVTSAEDILEELRGVGRPGPVVPAAREEVPAAAAPAAGSRSPAAEPEGLSPEEAQVWGVLRAEPLHVDELAHASGLAPSNVLAALLGLELRGAVESLPGKQYRRA
ncbi:MAG TPA: DNA-processing protein DprA [Longimicrobiaceae bacterium]|nr:DNA-processing protein DprA [Longimicrobiaceae bacterium]